MAQDIEQHPLDNILARASTPLDADEVAAAVTYLGHAGNGITELNAIGPDGVIVEYVNNVSAAVDFAMRHAGKLLLVGINPRDPVLIHQGKSATNQEVAAVCNLYLDIEPDISKDAAATREEIMGAHAFILAHLSDLPNDFILEFSGRGFHLHVALPPRTIKEFPEFPGQVRTFMQNLKRHFADDLAAAGLRMDITADPRRMLKIPGTGKPGLPLRSVWMSSQRHENADCGDLISSLPGSTAAGSAIPALESVPLQLPAKFTDLLPYYPMLKSLFEDPATDRSERDWGLAKELAKHSFSREETASVINVAPYNAGKELTRRYLEFTIGKVHADAGTTPAAEHAAAPATVAQESEWLTTAEELFNESEKPIEYLVEGLLPARDVGLLVGVPGSLKTWIMLELGLAVGTGTPMLGKFPVPKPGNVIYIGEEVKKDVLRRRLGGLAASKGLSGALIGERVRFAVRKGVKLDDPQWQARIRKVCEKHHPVLVILDPLAGIIRANEDSAQDMRPILDFLRDLEKEFGCAVILVHHVRKAREKDGPSLGQRIRGTSAFEGWADTLLFSSGHPSQPCSEIRVEHRDAPDPEAFSVRLVDEAGRQSLKYEEGGRAELARMDLAEKMLGVLREHPDGLTNDELKDCVGGKTQSRATAVKDLLALKKVEKVYQSRMAKDGKTRKLGVLRIPGSTPTPPPGSGNGVQVGFYQQAPATPTPYPPLREGVGLRVGDAGPVEQEGQVAGVGGQ